MSGRSVQLRESPTSRAILLSGAGAVVLIAAALLLRAPSTAASSANRETPVAAIPEPYPIEIIGSDNRWHGRYPDAAGEPAKGKVVPSARIIRVPLNTDVVFILKSTDYLYTVTIPHFGLKEIAVPKLEFRMKFRATEPGRYELVGDELCGDPHIRMRAQIRVQSRERMADWLKK